MPVMTTRLRMMTRVHRPSERFIVPRNDKDRQSHFFDTPAAAHWPICGETHLQHVRLSQRPRLAGRHVDRTGRVGLLVVERRRHDAVLQRQQAGGQLGRAAAGAEVADVALGGEHRHRLAQFPKTSCNPCASQTSASTVLRPWALTWSMSSAPMPASASAARTARARPSPYCFAVERRPEADHLGVNPRRAGVRVPIPRARARRPLAEHQAVAAAVERTARLLRGVVALRQRLEQALADHAQRIDLALGAADEEEIGLVAAQDADTPRPAPAGWPRRFR